MTNENMLEKTGLHFDDLNKIRVLEPEIAQQTTNLKDECQEFISSNIVLFYDFLYIFFFNHLTSLQTLKTIYQAFCNLVFTLLALLR